MGRGIMVGMVMMFITILIPLSLHAAATPWAEQEFSRVRVIAAEDMTLPTGRRGLVGGLHFTLNDGWKIYWRNAGDAGLPPRITLEPSENIAGVELLFPGPTRYVESWGLQAFGYSKEVVYPLLIQRKTPDAMAALRLTVDYMVCEEICIPFIEKLSIVIPPDPVLAPEEKTLLEQYTARLALPADTVPPAFAVPRLFSNGQEHQLEVMLQEAGTLTDLDIFVEGPNGYGFGVPKPVAGKRHTYRLPILGGLPAEALSGEPLKMTLVADQLVMKQTLTADGVSPLGAAVSDAPTKDAVTSPEKTLALPLILLFAYIGGLILNVMPCVLPVLSLKLIGVLRHHEKPGSVRAGFLVTAAGEIGRAHV